MPGLRNTPRSFCFYQRIDSIIEDLNGLDTRDLSDESCASEPSEQRSYCDGCATRRVIGLYIIGLSYPIMTNLFGDKTASNGTEYQLGRCYWE